VLPTGNVVDDEKWARREGKKDHQRPYRARGL